MNVKEIKEKLKITLPTVYLCLKDPKTPALAKVLSAITIGYALSPVDLIPDFIPILGYLDDLVILPALCALTVKQIPSDVWEENETKAKDIWKDGKPKKWYYAIPIVICWLLIFSWILKLIF